MSKENSTNNIITTILIFFYFPFGIPYMWVTRAFNSKTRWIITLSFIAAIVLGLGTIILWTSSPGYIH